MKCSKTALICGLLVGMTLAAYWPLFRNDFIRLDDHHYIVENPHVLSGLTWANIKWAFTTGYTSNWHPLTWISHQLDVQLFGLRPGWHHAENLLFHIANALLLFVVLRKMTGCLWRSAMVAALFGLHPLHVESVAWAAERKDVLSTFFFMLTLLSYAAYVQSRSEVQSPKSKVQSLSKVQGPKPNDQSLKDALRTRRPQSWRYYSLAFFFFACGLMSKPMLVTTPFVLLLLDFWPLQRFAINNQKSKIKNIVLEKVPFLALCIASSVVTFVVQDRGHSTSTMEGLPLEPRLVNALLSYLKYLGKTFWPADLAIFYPHPGIHGPAGEAPDWQVAVAALLLMAVSASVLFRLKREPWLATGWFWYVGTLVPVIGIVQVGGQEIADRYTYIPLIGIFLAFTWWAADFVADRNFGAPAIKWGGVLVVLACVFLTERQVKYWHNNLSVFEHALKVTQNNAAAQYQVGVEMDLQGKIDLAAEHFRAAIEADPSMADAHYALGVLLARQGKADEAIEQYGAALLAKPWHAMSHNALGAMYWQRGQRDQAVGEYREALRLNPDFAEAHYNLGVSLSTEGKLEEAATHFTETVRLNPGNVQALSELARLLGQQGKLVEAENCCRALVRLRPADPEAHNNLGVVLRLEKKPDEALSEFDESLRLKSAQADPHFGLGTIFLEQGKPAEAETHFMEAVRLKPNDAEAWTGLGHARVLEGKLDQAGQGFEQTARLRPDAQSYYELGMLRVMQGKSTEAITNYEQAVRLNPDYIPALNDLAWELATDPHAELRNGAEAARLAEHARDLSGGKIARFWGTLDAAYAEAGRWPEALHAAQKAKELALVAGEKKLADAADKRIKLYENQQPFHQGN